jgi:hypothetical protein
MLLTIAAENLSQSKKPYKSVSCNAGKPPRMEEILNRLSDNLLGRSSGPMNFRLIMQPTVAIFIAIRAGVRDAREGRPAFLWAAFSNPAYRTELLHEGWKDVGKVFILAIVLDSIYQLIVHRGVYVLELLITATVLAIIPYVLVRGPVNRIARKKPVQEQILKRMKAS